ncbi:hypothetical protein COCSADRAFT_84909 [Bipolaris sorokiniana ND90Pr]|uniref:Uncharacterized protein n=1 Tax=Cochliobolus sativus (strain ND90Pr / ATCC 201652) TaxID=665912 RepID=M2RI57_COCSN|nr:uncharacterized protein COCSADRAFT_84909 [Bipolaris sorokiniana ND90Pr]EMD66434.1 hypothetical protein COCSADRAFT_84909 [Bipolaris sorokiniana ND90Pr]
MLKVLSSCRVRAEKSNKECYSRANYVIEQRNEITVYRYKRCKKKGLRYFIDTTTRRCSGCIAIKAKYSLFISKEK